MRVEVIFYDHIGNYNVGQVAEIEDGTFLRALLKGGHADVVNPPDWSPDTPTIKEPETEFPTNGKNPTKIDVGTHKKKKIDLSGNPEEIINE